MQKIALAAVAASLFGASPAHAVLLTFTTDEYTPNFVEPFGGAQVSHDLANGRVQYFGGTTASAAASRYDTTPGNGTFDDIAFKTETVSFDATFGAVDNRSAGIFTRVQSSNGLGVLALFNPASTTSAQLRLFYNADTFSGTPGTAFYDNTFNLTTGAITGTGTGGTGSTNPIAASSPITIQLTQTGASDPVFSITVSDAQGLVASSGSQTLSSGLSDAYDGPGAIAVRFNAGAGQGITMDNFQIVPEPASLTALAGGLGVFGLRRRRRTE